MRRRKHRKMSRQASAFIANKVRILRDEGYSRKQAVAIAYSTARRRGYKIPRRRGH